ncbi:hypothetical protein [Granulicella tundricola]|uniref:hypothetical protein n=1 Tax=Granulicella tundricola TaxID=940615 RepID=UPI0012F9D623|nr:hypothetical protein [Granulicella tundricola]
METKIYFKGALPLRKWREAGSYVVVSSDSKKIVLRASRAEVGNAFFTDVEFLLDHAAEHQATLYAAIEEASWCSPAWSFVTAYYWSFFSVLALTRLAGDSTWFLDKTALIAMEKLAQTSSGRPGAGTQFMTVSLDLNGDAEVTIRPSGKNNHEAVWNRAMLLSKRVLASANKASSLDEYRFWKCIVEAGFLLGEAWPSHLRNDVNYIPGYAYGEVRSVGIIKTAADVRRLKDMSFRDFLNDFESELYRITSGVAALTSPEYLVKLALLNAFAVSLVANSLHKDILSRVDGDFRWSRMRQRFLEQRVSTSFGNIWPFEAH